MRVTFGWNRPLSTIAYERSGGDEGRLYLANTCKRFMDKYVPFKMGVLSQNVRIYVRNQTGYIVYNSPYAHYQFEGILYVSSKNGSAWASAGEHKVKAQPERSLEYSKARHPLATSHWDKAMMTARKADLTASYQRWLRRRSSE